ncbi:MAG: DsbC family protein [Pseudomonadota bacterium]
MKQFVKTLLGCTVVLACSGALAQEAQIRKNIAARLPQIKVVDEVSKTPIPGVYELRINGSEIFYTDAQANYLIEGNIIDVRAKRNLTEERVTKLTAIKFEDLPLKDAFTIVRGDGKRKIAVFEDPNCGYCKRFERDLQKVDNVTVYMFLYPILGAESVERSKAIWCAKDPAKAWLDWMVRDQPSTAAPSSCDSAALARNAEFGRTYKITGTPTLFFVDGARVPGAIDSKQIEKTLADIKG